MLTLSLLDPPKPPSQASAVRLGACAGVASSHRHCGKHISAVFGAASRPRPRPPRPPKEGFATAKNSVQLHVMLVASPPSHLRRLPAVCCFSLKISTARRCAQLLSAAHNIRTGLDAWSLGRNATSLACAACSASSASALSDAVRSAACICIIPPLASQGSTLPSYCRRQLLRHHL